MLYPSQAFFSKKGQGPPAATIKASDLKGLKRLAAATGDRFKMGVVLYNGTETMPMGERLCAVPVSTLKPLDGQ